MSYLVDTNVLLRLVQKTSPMHPDARKAIFILRRQGFSLCIIPGGVTSALENLTGVRF